jgi:hypothetical protein
MTSIHSLCNLKTTSDFASLTNIKHSILHLQSLLGECRLESLVDLKVKAATQFSVLAQTTDVPITSAHAINGALQLLNFWPNSTPNQKGLAT